MSLLVILLPPRPRGDAAPASPSDFSWVLSSDGASPARQGRSPAAALPAAEQVVAVVADTDLSWHRLAIPKAPAARLRAAVGAMLEELLLEDDEALHVALEPGLVGGQTGWVAVASGPWLRSMVAALDAAGVTVERIVPASWPGEPASMHALADESGADVPRLVCCDADGVAVLRLAGGLARQRLLALQARGPVALSAHPAVAAKAEQAFEAPVAVLGDGERALRAARSPWNLRQFDLVPQHRGLRALSEALRRLRGPAWRPVRVGLAALLAVNVVGLNVAAWQLERTLEDKRGAMTRLLQTTHPQVRSVLDAPLQMQRETEALRAAAGRAGPADLEAMLALAAGAWPEGQPPLQALRFEPGRLTITVPGWGDAQRAAFAERARGAGYRAEPQSGGRIVISREART